MPRGRDTPSSVRRSARLSSQAPEVAPSTSTSSRATRLSTALAAKRAAPVAQDAPTPKKRKTMYLELPRKSVAYTSKTEHAPKKRKEVYVDLAPRRFTSRSPTQDDDDGTITEPDDDAPAPAQSPSSIYYPRSLAIGHRRNKPRAAANGSTAKRTTTREAARRVPAAPPSDTSVKPFLASATSIEKKGPALLRDEFQRLAEKQKAIEEAASHLRIRQRAFDQNERVSRELAAERKARAAYEQLEDHFTCSLCIDIMAYPVTLNPYSCGHTFCALCILKWVYSRQHDCGQWHEGAECPVCRAVVLYPDDEHGRVLSDYPCAPNRLVQQLMSDLVEKLNMPHAAGDKPAWSEWREGKTARVDWENRCALGRAEMLRIGGEWGTIAPDMHREARQRLGV